jgi:ATP-dependent protease ClpP protease subunit
VPRPYEQIEIRGFVANDHSEATLLDITRRIEQAETQPGATKDGVRQCVAWLQRPVFADDVVAALADMEAGGGRVVFVPVDGPGGHIDGSRRIYDALRAFSGRGGFVVTCLSGPRVASSAPLIALAGDVVCAVPESKVWLHSASGPRAAEANLRAAELIYDRTVMPSGSVEECLDREGFDEDGAQRLVEVPLDEIIKNGFADQVCELEVARAWALQVALMLEAGMSLPSKRDEPGGRLCELRGMQALRSRKFVVHNPPGSRSSAAEASRGGPTSCAVTADKIAANSLRTTNYAQDASGNPTAGAKLDHQGVALKVAPANLQIGNKVLTDFAAVRAAGGFNVNAALSYSHNIASVTFGPLPSATSYTGLKILFTAPIPLNSTPIVTRGAFGGNATALTMHPFFAGYQANAQQSLDGFWIGFTDGAGAIFNANNGYAQVFYAMLGGWGT